MTLVYCTSSLTPPPPKQLLTTDTASKPVVNFTTTFAWPKKLLLHAFTNTLSFTLLFSSPSTSFASVIPQPLTPSLQSSSSEYCTEEEKEVVETAPELVTNEGIVEEAWEIVKETFLDSTSKHRWSLDDWMQRKNDIIGSTISTRSKAHGIIRRMLSSLGDPYTRFLPPSEV
ncbi:hypothetical protein IFM89_006123 [Coptis chinensis]|uniref:Uncharacterized protein n=1 Tax=Coptis chinensis TaxID=261450 RepID=A0A835GVS0_9MAGN|nr:hypothetical protein IFM89_006123 [Coptis chinensis]